MEELREKAQEAFIKSNKSIGEIAEICLGEDYLINLISDDIRNRFDDDELREIIGVLEDNREIRAYLVSFDSDPRGMTDDQIIDKAEELGFVFTLKGFLRRLNEGYLDLNTHYLLIKEAGR